MTSPPRYLPICPTVRPYRCGVWACRYHAWRAPTACTLDVAAEGPQTHAEIANVLGVCTERVRQIEAVALRKALAESERRGLSPMVWAQLDWADAGPGSDE